MSEFASYRDKYENIKMERRDGILEIGLHTMGGPFQWQLKAQADLVEAFTEIGADKENRIIILTGTGDEFSGPRSSTQQNAFARSGVTVTPRSLEGVHWNAKRLMMRLLDIEVPMIAAVNGPAKRHSELPLLCDIVLASEDATFEDTAHFTLGGLVPGNGVNFVYTMLLGINRARYFMLTGQVIGAKEAKELGLVGEILPREKLMERAWELATQLAQKPDLLLRYTRLVLTDPLRQVMEQGLQRSLALEALATLDSLGA